MNTIAHPARFFSFFEASFRSLIKVVCLVLATVVSCLPAQASPHQCWKQGNAFYQQKQYDSAAACFERIATHHPDDPKVFYNLGNTYYRLNKIGLAVLNYERALKRKPDYTQASENLALTQSRIPGFIQPVKDIFFIRWWKALTASGLIMVWSILSLILFIVFIGLLLYRRLNRGKVYIRPQIPGMLCLLWLFSLLLTFSAAMSAVRNVKGVILFNNTSISRNDANGKLATVLPEGTTVRILSKQATLYEVELPDGRSGFVNKAALQIVD